MKIFNDNKVIDFFCDGSPDGPCQKKLGIGTNPSIEGWSAYSPGVGGVDAHFCPEHDPKWITKEKTMSTDKCVVGGEYETNLLQEQVRQLMRRVRGLELGMTAMAERDQPAMVREMDEAVLRSALEAVQEQDVEIKVEALRAFVLHSHECETDSQDRGCICGRDEALAAAEVKP